MSKGRSPRGHDTKANVQYTESINILQVEQSGEKMLCTSQWGCEEEKFNKISLNLSSKKVMMRFRT